MPTLERAQTKHKSVVDAVTKLALKRDKALDALIRAETRYRKAIKGVARSTKRLDKLREEARAVRAARTARKKAQAEPTTHSAEDVLGI